MVMGGWERPHVHELMVTREDMKNCTALQCTAMHCNALQFTAMHCTALHITALYWAALIKLINIIWIYQTL